MKKYEVLYDWPITEIRRLADSNEAETFSESLEPEPLDSFTTLTEQMRGLGVELAAAKAARQHFVGWQKLRQALDVFGNEFSGFPDVAIVKFRLFVLLAEKLRESEPLLDAEDVDESAFRICALVDSSLPVSWFSRENSKDILESMAVFGIADFAALELEMASSNMSPEFAFYLLAALQAMPVMPLGHAAFVKNAALPVDIAAIEAFVRMMILATGKPIHLAKRYLSTPSVIDADEIKFGNMYQQWGDVLTVLSEYNSRDELLLKYLTIYHVVENFMFKLPIVGLERQQNGRMFSIRDFQRLYRKVDISEGDALKQLFSAVLKLDATKGITFERRIANRWSGLTPVLSKADIDGALQTFGLPFTYSTFKNQAAHNFAKLVYFIRNAIVHNKETEFHLTYASLDSPVCALIEVFLLPSLEEICFSLIGTPNAELWYQNKELVLYR